MSSRMVRLLCSHRAFQLHSDSRFTTKCVFAAVGPLFLGPLSEIYGRSRVLQLANLFFVGTFLIARPGFLSLWAILVETRLGLSAFNLACAFAQTKGQLIAFRFLSGLGGSAPLAVRAMSLCSQSARA